MSRCVLGREAVLTQQVVRLSSSRPRLLSTWCLFDTNNAPDCCLMLRNTTYASQRTCVCCAVWENEWQQCCIVLLSSPDLLPQASRRQQCIGAACASEHTHTHNPLYAHTDRDIQALKCLFKGGQQSSSGQVSSANSCLLPTKHNHTDTQAHLECLMPELHC